jgi:hypothetical protein
MQGGIRYGSTDRVEVARAVASGVANKYLPGRRDEGTRFGCGIRAGQRQRAGDGQGK